jgi:hypothetical protein
LGLESLKNDNLPEAVFRDQLARYVTPRATLGYITGMHLYMDIDGVLIRDGKPMPRCFSFLR